MLDRDDETEPHTEPEGVNLGGMEETIPRRGRGPQLVERHGNNRLRSVRISTISGSQEAANFPWTPAARVTITCGRPLSPATFSSLCVGRCLSPHSVPSTTRSGIRSSSRPGEQSTRGTLSLQHVIVSRQNTVTGMEGEILGVAKDVIVRDTLYVNPLPNPVALTSEVQIVWVACRMRLRMPEIWNRRGRV